jgi:hypothetical protein
MKTHTTKETTNLRRYSKVSAASLEAYAREACGADPDKQLALVAESPSFSVTSTPAGEVTKKLVPQILGVVGRGLHSFTSQLNLSALCGIGGARRDCVARVKGVLGGV